MISPLPSYDVHWTSKLIRRDIRDLKTRLKNRFSKRVRGTPRSDELSAVTAAEEPEVLQHIVTGPSIETASTEMTRDESSRPSTASTAPTEVNETPPEATPRPVGNFYELLDARLKAMYASRDRNMSHDERWQLRGSYLVLSMALQACPSYAVHDIFRDGQSAVDEAGLLLDVLQYSTPTTHDLSAAKVSQMPTMPYTKRNGDRLRYDSAFSAVSFVSETSQTTLKQTKTSSPAYLWHAILEAATNESKTVPITESLLGHIWPNRDAVQTLNRIGHPGKVFCNEEFAELRLKLREMLFPEHNDLVNDWQLRLAA